MKFRKSPAFFCSNWQCLKYFALHFPFKNYKGLKYTRKCCVPFISHVVFAFYFGAPPIIRFSMISYIRRGNVSCFSVFAKATNKQLKRVKWHTLFIFQLLTRLISQKIITSKQTEGNDRSLCFVIHYKFLSKILH